MVRKRKYIGNDSNENKTMKDIVTKIYLEEPFYIQQTYEDMWLTAPNIGSLIKISEEFKEPIICKRKYINDSAVSLLEACGIKIETKTRDRHGMKKRVRITGKVDGIEITVHLYYRDNWENPPQRLDPNIVWFNSQNGDVVNRYTVVKRFLVDELGLHIIEHKCIDRLTKLDYKCPE